jgi:hypothetical protein
MIINTEADKTVIACSLHGREYFSAFSDQMSVEDMRRELIALLAWMEWTDEQIRDILGLDI